MTEIYVAKRTGILREPDGTQHRLYAGKTLAAAGHPAVTGSPESWRPMTIDLPHGDDAREQGDPGHLEDSVAEELAEVEAERDGLVLVLSTISDGLEARGLLGNVNREEQGWLVSAVFAALDGPESAREQVGAPALADPETAEGRQAIREWAWAHEIDVAERGTIPKAVVEQYRAAHA